MNDQEQLWCELFLQTGSVAVATKQAGYGNPNQSTPVEDYLTEGKEIALRPDIQTYMQKLFNQDAMAPSEIISRLTKLSRGDMSNYFAITDDGKVKPDFIKAQKLGAMSNIKKLRYDERTHYTKDGEVDYVHVSVQIELYAADVSLKTLATYYNMFDSTLPLDYAKQLWIYFVKGLVDLPYLYQELGVEGTHKLLDDIPLPASKQLTIDA